jgi:glycosyltransferase involved in cell wall biosynthesis
MVVVTACTRHYLPRVRVLARSFLEHVPEGRVTALVLDALPGDPPEPLFDVLRPEQVIRAQEFARMATAYDLIELATSVKPALLMHMLDEADAVHFVDPDVRFHGDPRFLDDLVRRHGIVLTPHLTRPPARRRGGGPGGEDVVLPAGVFNLGYIGVSRAADPRFLTWWDDRLARDCLNDTVSARFVDQRWIDLVPGYFAHHIERHPGVNVAWWNMPDRPVSRRGGRWMAAGRPIVFLHASGVDPHVPQGLSRHHSDEHAFQPEPHSPLAELVADYAEDVMAAGHGSLPPPEPGLRRATGLHITSEERRRYRVALLRHERGNGPEPPNPFTDGVGPFICWVDGSRPREAGLVPPPGTRMRGINLVGHFSAPSGVGMAARLIARALRDAGVPHSTYDLDRHAATRHRVPWDDVRPGLFDSTVLCVNADEALHANHRLPPDLRSCTRVGIWWWETENFPDRFDEAFSVVDEVWTGSEFTRRAIASRSDRPVRVIPMPVVVTPDPDPGIRTRIGVDTGAFMVAAVISLDSVFERKNPLGVIDAYRGAFALDEGCVLVLKVTGHDDGTRLDRLRFAARGRSDIRIIDETWPVDDVHALIASCDCLLSLHRSEGFGLTIAEALAYGRPVVATGYGGNTQFMDASCAYVVPWRLARIPRDARPYDEGTLWADPDVDVASTLLRAVRDDPAEATRRASAGRKRISTEHAPARAGEAIRTLVDARRTATARIPARWWPRARRGTATAGITPVTAGHANHPTEPAFYHSMRLPDGRSLQGDWTITDMHQYLGRVPMAGRRVLDAGTATGALAYACEARGARDVVALDLPLDVEYDARVPVDGVRRMRALAWRRAVRAGFHMCHDALGSDVRLATGDLRALRSDLGRFDVCLLGNVLQHLRDPSGALLTAAGLCNALVVTEADWMHGRIADDVPALVAFESDQPYSWYQARPAWVTDLLSRNGFEDITVTRHSQRYHGSTWPSNGPRPQPVDVPHFTVVAWHQDVPPRHRRVEAGPT